MTRTTHKVDIAIVGFGFSGLATLAHLTRSAGGLCVAVIAPDRSGRGLAYGTDDTSHLLNVPADRMGAWADDEGDFAAWLGTPQGRRAGDALGVPLPGPEDFAPRALFAQYLAHVRDVALGAAREHEIDVSWVSAEARRVNRGPRGWSIATAEHSVQASACVLATGNDRRSVFGSFAHPALHDGPWDLKRSDLGRDDGPVALIGSGLTAVDAFLTLRRLGHQDEIAMLSRGGLLPRAHSHTLPSLELRPREVDGIRTLAELEQFVAGRHAEGHDWRTVVDAMRPYSVELWQRLDAEDQSTALERWSARWNVYRHRMAPSVASRIDRELSVGGLTVSATRSVTPRAQAGRLELDVVYRDGSQRRLAPVLVIDCTGPQLDCGDSDQPLLHDLVAGGPCTPHHTGLGLAADERHRVAEDLYAIGSLLAGQLWETIAVPELREQAATIAEGLSGAAKLRAA